MAKEYLINGALSGKVNVPSSFVMYTGEETDTANLIVDNKTRKISANVKVEEVKEVSKQTNSTHKTSKNSNTITYTAG